MTPSVPPARTAVLGNQDLLTLIFSDFILDPIIRESSHNGLVSMDWAQRQLLHLATTCKIFKEPALDCLWNYLPSLLPIVKLLPNLQVAKEKGGGYDVGNKNTYYFHGPIPRGSEIFKYASRVRYLHYNSGLVYGEPKISPQVYVQLVKELAGEPLFPNLCRLRTYLSAGGISTFLTLLPLTFSSSVATAELHGGGFESPLFSSQCLPLVAQQSRSLKHLCIEKYFGYTMPPSALDNIALLEGLERLDIRMPKCTGILPETLAELGKALKKLTSLTLDLHFPTHQVQAVSPNFDEDVSHLELFPSLTDVNVIARCGEQVCQCTPSFLLSRVNSLELILSRTINDPDYFLPIVNAFRQHQPSGLRRLEIGDDGRTSSGCNLAAISPFLKHLPITEFELTLRGRIECNGKGLRPLIDAAFSVCPTSNQKTAPNTLQSISIEWNKSNFTVGPGSLLYTATHGVELERLSVGVDIDGVEDFLDGLDNAIFQPTTLRYLAIGDRSSFGVKTYFPAAQFLDLPFPQLVAITVCRR